MIKENVLDDMPEGATLVDLSDNGTVKKWLKLNEIGELYVRCFGSWDREPNNDFNNLQTVSGIRAIIELQD